MNFCHLHAHSTYSILDAWGQPDQIAARVEEAGLTAHALTDHDSTSGHWKFSKEMLKRNLKPLFGIEIRVVDDLEQREWRSPEGRRFYPYHLGLIARTQEGYRNLTNLTTLAWAQGMGGRGKYMPVVTWGDIKRMSAGLVGTSGCLSGKLNRAVLGQVEDDWRDVLAMQQDCFEPGQFFVEWQNLPLDASVEVAKVLSLEANTVVTHDVHFTVPEMREAQNIMSAIMRWKKVVGPDGQGPMDPNCYLASAQEVLEIAERIDAVDLRHVHRAMENTVAVADSINVELPMMPMVRFPYDGDKIELFKSMINEGWRKRRLDKLPKAKRRQYLERVRYEVDIIIKKDYVDYFLMITDICQFCIREDILKGPARGSSAGSLVAWCLEITEVNPIEHGLIFERFIDLNRADLPDIDLDFPSSDRERIHEYLRSRYGAENVAPIGTFTTFKAKRALDDVARVFELPQWVPNKIKPYIPDRAHGDVRSDMTLVDSMEAFDDVKAVVAQHPDIAKATLLEGQFRAMGIHPAGVIISSVRIEDVVPIYEHPGKGRVAGLDGWDVADAGMVKFDILGITAMDLIQTAREAIRENHDIDVDFYNLPLDDPETMQGFTEVDVLGIFQFSGKATKNTLRQIRPTTFAELVDINTLSRPGAMLAGTNDAYVQAHRGRTWRGYGSHKAQSIHPVVDKITESTYNLVLYQEQVLAIMREFGGLSWSEAGEVRKFLSKRMGMEILQQFRDQFVGHAVEHTGVSEELAEKVWLQTSTFGAYGFNKSHSVSYSMVAYWQMYLKRHYPREFYYAALAHENDSDSRNLFIKEARRKGVRFLPVDPNRSARTFRLEPDGIRYGLQQVRGIGEKTADLIIANRPFRSWRDIAAIKGLGPKTIELFKQAYGAGDDLFSLEAETERLIEIRERAGAISIGYLMEMAEAGTVDTTAEYTLAAYVISRNYRQQEKLATQITDTKKSGAKTDTVILYVRDELGESFPVVVPGWLGGRKSKEIWEEESDDVYLIRGKLPDHGKFYLANGIANTGYQDRLEGELRATEKTTPQLSLTL